MSRYSSTVLSMNPVAYWRLGEPSGTVATDQVGAHNGTYTSSPTLNTAGMLTSDADTAVSFAPANSHVVASAAKILSGLANMTIMAWVKGSVAGTIYCERDSGGTDIVKLEVDAGTSKAHLYYRDDIGTLDSVFGPTQVLNDNAIHFVVFTMAGTTLTIYVDGVAGTPVTRTATLSLTNTIASWIAGDSFAGAYYAAAVDEVALFNRAVGSSEILTLYAVGTTTQPSLAVTLGGTDITADWFGLQYARGGNFDGTSESPGTATVEVANIAGKYNPANGASPIAGVLKIGSEVRVTATYGAAGSVTTYGVYHGFLRRIVPLPAQTIGYQTAQLLCEDALWKLGRAEVNIPVSSSTGVNAFRAAILTAAGEASNRRNLSLSGPEADNPVTYTDHAVALTVLTDLNKATGTLHFIKPHATTAIGYQYTTIDRCTLEASTSVETFDDTDLSKPFGTYQGGHDHTDEGVINSQRVIPHPRVPQPARVTVWNLSQYPYTVAAGTTVPLWANWTDPAQSVVVSYTATNSPTVVLSGYGSSSLITITAGGSDAVFTDLTLTGIPITAVAALTTLSSDATSQAAYGLMRGNDIDSQYLMTIDMAKGLGDYYIWRYKTPRSKPVWAVENRFPSILSREIGDRITLSSTVLSITNKDYFIRAISGVVSDSGNRWVVTYNLEEAPASLGLFTIGGDAAHGIGGASQILGY